MNAHRRPVPARTARRLVQRTDGQSVRRTRVPRVTERRAAIAEQLA